MPIIEMNVECCERCDRWLTSTAARIKCPGCGHVHTAFRMLRLFTKHFSPARMLGRKASS